MKILKTLLKSVRQYKVPSLLTVLFMAGEVGLEVALPYVMSMLVDEMQVLGGSLQNIWIYAALLLAMSMLSLVFGMCGGIFGAKASTGFAKNLRQDLFEKIQTFSFENIDHFSQSSLVTRLTTDITNVQNSYQMCIRIVIRAPLMFIFSIIMAFIMGGNMAWIFVILIPFISFGLIIIIKKAMPVFNGVFAKYDKLNESIQENIDGIRVVKSYVREDYEQKKFNNASDEIKSDFIKAEKIMAFNNPLMQFGMYAANVSICLIGSILIISTFGGYVDRQPQWGSLSTGQLSSLLSYGSQILMSLMIFSMIFVMFTMSLASIKRVVEVMNEVPTICNCKNPVSTLKDGSVEFKDVSFKYNSEAEKNALSGINLKINSGDIVGIIGSTGSGKTTLVNLISRLYDVSEGEIKVGGLNVRDYDIQSLRDKVAVVLQKNVLFSGTILSNLKWGDKDATEEEVVEACKIAQCDDFINSFPEKYNTVIEQGGTNVSGGQKQRLCIARALLKRPQILILDDSTSAVDTKTDSLIRKGLKNDLPNTTKIIIAQRISSIEGANMIIVLDDGKINAIGTNEELLKTNKIYQEVYNTQNKLGGK